MSLKNRHIGALTVAVLVGTTLMGFQNCSGGMHASQSFQNDVLNQDLKMDEHLDGMMAEEIRMSQAVKQLVCSPTDVPLRWPFGGTPFKDWVVGNYVDLDPSTAVVDYTGKAFSYDGHRGLDIFVPSFRAMDLDFPVLAAAPGKVIEVVQGFTDRNRACVNQDNNYVKIQHANGIRTIYAHLKRNSVTVTVGSQVVAGQKIGVVGSSGCSAYPHLHFEVVDCNGKLLDPMQLRMIANAPTYTPAGTVMIMDTLVKQPYMTLVEQMVDPGPYEPQSVKADVTFSMGFTASTVKAGSVMRMDLVKPDGTPWPQSYPITNTAFRTLAHWYVYFTIPNTMTGTWTFKISVDGVPKTERKVLVVP